MKVQAAIECVLRGHSEILIARPAVEIEPKGEPRRFILKSESEKLTNGRRTGRQGWQVSTVEGNVIESLGTPEFMEKYSPIGPPFISPSRKKKDAGLTLQPFYW